MKIPSAVPLSIRRGAGVRLKYSYRCQYKYSKIMKTLSLTIITLATITLCVVACNKTSAIMSLNAENFEEKLNQTDAAQLIDVRTPEEFKESRLPDAVNFAVNDENFAQKISQLDKNQPVFLYCRSGKRSIKAAQILEKLGFTTIYNLEGGILEWKEKGKTTEAN